MARLFIRRIAASCIIVVTLVLAVSSIYWSLNDPLEVAKRVLTDAGRRYSQSTPTLAAFTSSPPKRFSGVPPPANTASLSQEQSQRVIDNKFVKEERKKSSNILILQDVRTRTTETSIETVPSIFMAKSVNRLNCSGGDNTQFPLLSDDGFVRHCVSHAVIGRVPRDVKTFNVKLVRGKVAETSPVRRQSFRQVFETRAWGHSWDAQYRGLNASGMGATLHWAQETIATLHTTIDQLKQRYGLSRVRLLDVPCGDMAWMSRFLATRNDIDYTGVDIVPELIQHHRTAFAGQPWKFLLSDVVHDGFNSSSLGGYNLVLCRTMLQHLYFPDVLRVLGHLSTLALGTDQPVYLLTTSFAVNAANDELVIDKENPGRFRKLNVEIPPISLSPPLCLTRDGPPEAYEGWNHFIGLWKLPLKRVSKCRRPAVVTVSGVPHKLYSCVDWSLDSN